MPAFGGLGTWRVARTTGRRSVAPVRISIRRLTPVRGDARRPRVESSGEDGVDGGRRRSGSGVTCVSRRSDSVSTNRPRQRPTERLAPSVDSDTRRRSQTACRAVQRGHFGAPILLALCFFCVEAARCFPANHPRASLCHATPRTNGIQRHAASLLITRDDPGSHVPLELQCTSWALFTARQPFAVSLVHMLSVFLSVEWPLGWVEHARIAAAGYRVCMSVSCSCRHLKREPPPPCGIMAHPSAFEVGRQREASQTSAGRVLCGTCQHGCRARQRDPARAVRSLCHAYADASPAVVAFCLCECRVQCRGSVVASNVSTVRSLLKRCPVRLVWDCPTWRPWD